VIRESVPERGDNLLLFSRRKEPGPCVVLFLSLDRSGRIDFYLLILNGDPEDQRKRGVPAVARRAGPDPLISLSERQF
jgi:hypothetical protein